MKTSEFHSLSKELFAKVLRDFGFDSSRSNYSTFYRQVSNTSVWHIIFPDLGTNGNWFDIKVFPYIDSIDPCFDETFPDEIGIPTDSYCFLSERGVGLDQIKWNCRNESQVIDRFESTISKLLKTVAIPFLDQFHSINSVLPFIRNPLSLAIANYILIGSTSSQAVLNECLKKLEMLPYDKKRAKVIQFIREL